MHLKQAFKILNLQSDSFLEDAKEAFRVQAKKHHPDRFVFDENLRMQAEEKMKDINLAFQLLSKRLKPRPLFKKEKIVLKNQDSDFKCDSFNKKEQKKRNSSWIHKFFDKASKFDFSKLREKSKKKKPVYNKSRNKTSTQRSSKDFHTVLNKVYNKKSSITRKRTSSNYNYEKYLKLKRQMKTIRRRSDFFQSPVEKISPVEPVQPIGR